MNKLFTFVSIIILTFANSANACPVCFDANEKSRIADYLTTAFLSLFPLLMIGCLVYWLKKYSGETEPHSIKSNL